jgi:hypothetical protein
MNTPAQLLPLFFQTYRGRGENCCFGAYIKTGKSEVTSTHVDCNTSLALWKKLTKLQQQKLRKKIIDVDQWLQT